MYETIYKIEETEVLLDVKTEGEIRNFRNLSRDFWVTNLEFPTKFYYTLLSIPMIRLFPADYRFWLTNLKVLLGNNKHSPYSYRNLIGHFFHWFFSKTIKSNIKADAFFLKRKNNYVVLFYLSKKDPSIIKVNIEKKNRVKFKKQIENEITSQLSALNIIHKDVFIPKILKYNTNSDLLYIEQQFLTHCKDIIFLSVSKKQEVLDKVMDFMYHFYIKNNLKGVKINKNVYNQKLKNIENLYKTDKILNIVFNKLSQLFMEDKIMFWCRIHNDLVHQNILYNNEGSIYIIDWGLSKEYYWANEFIRIKDIKESSLNNLFTRISEYLNFKKTDVYNLKEQIFIVCCLNFLHNLNFINDSVEENNFLNSSKALIIQLDSLNILNNKRLTI